MRRRVLLNSEFPQKILLNLSHSKQKYNWDCGVACVLMVLPKKEQKHLVKNFTRICHEEGITGSTWTIDLCYLLQRYQIKHTFYTVTLGVHPGYRTNNSYYEHILNKDEYRISERFRNATETGISVHQGRVSVTDILRHIAIGGGPAIVLTNARLLTCDVCKLNKVSSELRKCLPWMAPPYFGHYIVVCGYEIGCQKVFYRNPSLSDRVCTMSLECFEEARKSYGTDEDIILLENCENFYSPK